ncbi:MBL fold metallo-hydrolase [Camelliibacillus cellulosilyticus]|uniref:MBL fold metallo-hydrolase n=1 Tax=Camelliibacillus cellulosilyticus TaxID=2174486 RepID=A0ABV9GL22_9BACL
MSLRQIEKDIWQVVLPTPFAVGPVNAFLLRKNERWLLIDAGPNTDEAEAVLIDALSELGRSPADLDAIVLTHHHPDHTGLIGRLSKAIPIYGHKRLGPWLSQNPAFAKRYNDYFRELARQMGVPDDYAGAIPSLEDYMTFAGKGTVDQVIDEGDRLPSFEEWTVIYTPGHAQSHISLLRNDGLMVAGDVLLERITSNAVLEPPYDKSEAAPKTLMQYRQSLEKCLTLPINKVLPGHGTAFDFTDSFVLEKLSAQEERRDQIFQSIKKEKLTAFQIGQLLFPNAWKRELDLVLSEVKGYVDWLLQDGKIVAVKSGTADVYASL